MVIHRFHTLRHYGEHLDPVWMALPPEARGETWVGSVPRNRPVHEPVLVAALSDAQTVAPSPYVLQDHGAGASYIGVTNGSYSGGEGHERCVLFLCPSERVAMRWRERYDVPAIAVGCPRLDRYSERPGRRVKLPGGPIRSFTAPRSQGVGTSAGPTTPASHVLVERATPNETASAKKSEKSRGETGSAWHKTGDSPLQPGIPTVAVSFHWDAAVCPETRSAWRYYDPHLPRLVRDSRFRIVGHGHPRLWPTIRRRWAELGVDEWPDVDRVLSEADLLVVDNSSCAFEMAAIGKPVVLLNLPSYRRDVEHGGRFWSHPPGIQVDHPSELADAIACALTDPPAHRAIRARAVAWSYDALNDGHASERATTAIMEVLSGRSLPAEGLPPDQQ